MVVLPLIFGPTSVAAHANNLRVELADDFDEVRLGGHHLPDVFVARNRAGGTVRRPQGGQGAAEA